jgi:hypothetical protein
MESEGIRVTAPHTMPRAHSDSRARFYTGRNVVRDRRPQDDVGKEATSLRILDHRPHRITHVVDDFDLLVGA